MNKNTFCLADCKISINKQISRPMRHVKDGVLHPTNAIRAAAWSKGFYFCLFVSSQEVKPAVPNNGVATGVPSLACVITPINYKHKS
jgi:hypothetical protein